MPRLSVWMIRTALLHLGTGFTLGAILLWNKGITLHPLAWSLLPLHIEVMLIGWTVQLAMGVSYWILPRWHTERRRVWLAGLAYVLLNIGVLLAGSAHWFSAPQMVLTSGRVAEAAAVLAFAVHAWPRIKPLGG